MSPSLTFQSEDSTVSLPQETTRTPEPGLFVAAANPALPVTSQMPFQDAGPSLLSPGLTCALARPLPGTSCQAPLCLTCGKSSPLPGVGPEALLLLWAHCTKNRTGAEVRRGSLTAARTQHSPVGHSGRCPGCTGPHPDPAGRLPASEPSKDLAVGHPIRTANRVSAAT